VLKPIFETRRRLLLRWSSTMCAGSLLLLPLTTPASPGAEAFALGAFRSKSPAPPLARLIFPAIAIRHNPFVQQVLPADGEADPANVVLPPNAALAQPVVRAVVVGSSPHALVEIGGQNAVVGVGSTLEGSVVTEIDSSGLLLDNGQRLPLNERRP